MLWHHDASWQLKSWHQTKSSVPYVMWHLMAWHKSMPPWLCHGCHDVNLCQVCALSCCDVWCHGSFMLCHDINRCQVLCNTCISGHQLLWLHMTWCTTWLWLSWHLVEVKRYWNKCELIVCICFLCLFARLEALFLLYHSTFQWYQ